MTTDDATLERVARAGYSFMVFNEGPWETAPDYTKAVWQEAARLQVDAYVRNARPWRMAVQRLAKVLFEVCRWPSMALCVFAAWLWGTHGAIV